MNLCHDITVSLIPEGPRFYADGIYEEGERVCVCVTKYFVHCL